MTVIYYCRKRALGQRHLGHLLACIEHYDNRFPLVASGKIRKLPSYHIAELAAVGIRSFQEMQVFSYGISISHTESWMLLAECDHTFIIIKEVDVFSLEVPIDGIDAVGAAE